MAKKTKLDSICEFLADAGWETTQINVGTPAIYGRVFKSETGKTMGHSKSRAAQNVKTGNLRREKKQAISPTQKLSRTTFRTSREMDFFSEKELVTQTGHDREEWPLVFVKEADRQRVGRLRRIEYCPCDRGHRRRVWNHGRG